MRAAVLPELAGPEAVRIEDMPEPVPDVGQLLIDVHYAGVVFPDLLNTRGEYQMRPSLPFIPGWDVAGVVREDAEGFRAGDRVAAMPLVGGFAESVAVDARMAFPLPPDVSLQTASTIPLNYLTMHFALSRRGQLRDGETVLVHGAAGGLGSAACQLAAAYGAHVIAVVSTEDKAAIAKNSGAHDVVFADDFLRDVRRLTGGRGVDIVVDPVGGDRFTDSLRSLATEGRVLVLGFTGRSIPIVKVNRLLLTNTTVMGVASEEFWQDNPDYARVQWTQLLSLIADGTIDPPVSRVYELTEAADALQAMDQRASAGRIVIQVKTGQDTRLKETSRSA
jgi:NADPH2:quinone reductase